MLVGPVVGPGAEMTAVEFAVEATRGRVDESGATSWCCCLWNNPIVLRPGSSLRVWCRSGGSIWKSRKKLNLGDALMARGDLNSFSSAHRGSKREDRRLVRPIWIWGGNHPSSCCELREQFEERNSVVVRSGCTLRRRLQWLCRGNI